MTKKKYDDLIELIKYIPNEHHSFFKNLKYKEDEIDFGLANSDDFDE